MSTAAPVPVVQVPVTPADNQVTVISHSQLFYWWPVWAVGYLMAILTYVDGHLLATVPRGTLASKEVTFAGDKREGYALPAEKHVQREYGAKSQDAQPQNPYIHMAQSKNFGVIFCVTLVLVIVITNVPLRGMWSLVVIITIILLSVIFALADWWETIFHYVNALDIRINAGGYLFISSALFIIWLATLLFFDQQTYIVFEPGQFKVCTEIGGGEKVYDTIGLTLERQRSDLFRHLILGLGSGDLIVKTTGAQAHHFDLPNVLFISSKLERINELLRRHSGGAGPVMKS